MGSWFSRWRETRPEVPAGRRVYAIGDIHGRRDLLDTLLDGIEADHRSGSPADATVILLGDLIDRGPDSAGVVARAMAGLGWAELLTLRGNHEDTLLATIAGDRRVAGSWLEYGGLATLRSWGADERLLADGSLDELIDVAGAVVPPAARTWLAALPTHVTIGGYHFVHAGVRPGVPLDAQADQDRIWIRDEFLDSREAFGAMVVHGHTQVREVDWRANRIGIDTGAYHSDQLTALALEGAERRLLQT